MITRFSSRRQKIAQSFLTERLQGARAYDRIAGYFSSSILEVAGEALESVTGAVRIVCNSQLEARDVETARAAQIAIRQEWCASEPERYPPSAKDRFSRLFHFLKSGKLEVRVVPNEVFGLIHGKAGVITQSDGRKTAFLGSTNESFHAWKLNYELLWEDDSEEAVCWVEEEFLALWQHPQAQQLADFVVADIWRLARRTVVGYESWKTEAAPDAAAPVIESPVYRREYGLWEHQKYFIDLAFAAHRLPHGARFVLADQVGLGKTLQLAMAAQLMALYGDKPVLIIAPKPLLWQWQDEMRNLLDMPSAVWDGRRWVDENGLEYPVAGAENIRKCPRRVGIISQGLIVRRSEAADILKQLTYECVIVDETHRARRKNLGPRRESERPDANNLLSFLYEISPKTRSLLLATATPVQLYPIEGWDLLNALSIRNELVLGNDLSKWRRPREALRLVLGEENMPEDDLELWGWIRNPLPPFKEGRDFEIIRRALRLDDSICVAPPESWDKLKAPDKARVRRIAKAFPEKHSPFIRFIVRRTREFLEQSIDPETGEPYLKPVRVELFGESDDEAIRLTAYLKDAYDTAETFTRLLAKRLAGSGFLKTLLLRRVGSTIHAGLITAEKMLDSWAHIETEEDEEAEEEMPAIDALRTLTVEERELLRRFIAILQAHRDNDPKYQVVLNCLLKEHWLERGCIVFSQYYDSIDWLAQKLTKELAGERIGIYAGGQKSGILTSGIFQTTERDTLKRMVSRGEIRLLLGTDAASEGLNLQRLGTLINLDLPWNPTRLEQRKGRIQRIGQLRDVVYIYNMRYKDSVEDRVHAILSSRLANIRTLFGQIPDVLEDVWIDVALGEIEKAKNTIDGIPPKHPFEMRYNQLQKIDWESCAKVLDNTERKRQLLQGW